jgi:hypothetical protein
MNIKLYPFIHNPLHGLSNDVSHLVPVYVPTQRHVNQVLLVFQLLWQTAAFKHGDDKHGLPRYMN